VKILALNWRDVRSPEAGGSETHLHEILRRLVLRGHQATLICSQFAKAKGTPREAVDGIDTIRVGAWWNAHVSVPRAAIRLMREQRFDVLLDDVNKIPFCAPSFSPIPTVALFLHLLGNTVFLETNPVFAAAIRLYEGRIGRVYRRTPSIAISRSTRDDLVHAGVDPTLIQVIEPGIDRDMYRAGTEPRALEPLVVLVSRLKRYKRVDVAIRAIARVSQALPAARLVVIGDGDQRANLDALSRDLAAPVTFLGRVSEDEKVAWLNRAHVVVSPSMKEGWGLSGIEALSCETPVVASDVHGHRDSVPEGAGILVPLSDVEATATALLDLLLDGRKRSAFGERGRAWAARFDWDRVADRFESVLSAAAGIALTREVVLSGVTP
jgi:glycosyltransferase involved in cell wall biosynthesis